MQFKITYLGKFFHFCYCIGKINFLLYISELITIYRVTTGLSYIISSIISLGLIGGLGFGPSGNGGLGFEPGPPGNGGLGFGIGPSGKGGLGRGGLGGLKFPPNS